MEVLLFILSPLDFWWCGDIILIFNGYLLVAYRLTSRIGLPRNYRKPPGVVPSQLEWKPSPVNYSVSNRDTFCTLRPAFVSSNSWAEPRQKLLKISESTLFEKCFPLNQVSSNMKPVSAKPNRAEPSRAEGEKLISHSDWATILRYV